MLAKLVKDVMDNPDWFYEMKLDGYRMICSVKDSKVNMISRNGKSFNKNYPVLSEDLGNIEDNVILDGEIVIENSKGISDFQLLQNYKTTRKGDLKYYVFDILYLNGHNIMNFPLIKRKELLDAFFSKYSFKHILKVECQTGNGRKIFEDLSAKGFEGVIAKDPESVYVPGSRNETWLKIKAVQMQEVVICGYTEPRNSRKYFGSLVMGLYEKDILKYIGNCGTGFNDTSLAELHGKFKLLKTDECPFANPPQLSWSKGKPAWLKPELVANVKFMEWSRDGIMRAPVFMGLREDKKPTEVVNEMKTITEESMTTEVNKDNETGEKAVNFTPEPIFKKEEKEKVLVIGGKKLKFTNLTKIYWPGEGFTKGDLISYYYRISKYILPYLKDRPQSLNRHPNGIREKSFYQKDMDIEQIPNWVKTVSLYSKSNDKNIDYMICNDRATLVYMANLGCIEINPWHSTYQKPDEPAYLMLDLDPGEISFIDVINTALVIKELCDEIGISCYCKTSGATGLHVYIPLGARYDYDQTKTFAGILAGAVHKRLPSTTSIERVVAKRKDRVYIDFLQNRKGQTIAAPYSVRPRPFATVSTPLRWDEVNHQLSPEMFTIKTIESRLNKTGDLWQPVLKTGISMAKALSALEKLS
jgi:bifunctional non-homologous end joining protein LigD